MSKCIICQSTDQKVIRRKLRFDIKRDVLKCNNCGLVFLRPLSSQLQEFYEDNQAYRGKYGPNLKNLSAGCRQRFDTYYPFQHLIVKEIEHLFKFDFKILDVGCSTGHFLAALKDKVKTRVGLELNQAEVEFIKANLDFKIYSEPIDKLQIPEAPFDIITALQVLEHLADPVGFLKSLARNLKPDGYLYLEVPNLNDVLLSGYKIEAYEDFYFREPHLSYFTSATLKRLLEQAGFSGQIKAVQRYNFLNHMHWLLTNHPQDNFIIGNCQPILVADKAQTTDPAIKEELNDFIKKVDQDYKQLLIKHDLGESLTFLGQVKKV